MADKNDSQSSIKFRDNPYTQKADKQIVNDSNSSFGVQNGNNAYSQAPSASKSDISQSILDALNYAGMAQTQSNSGITNRESATSRQAAANYEQKKATDYKYEQASNDAKLKSSPNSVTTVTEKFDPRQWNVKAQLERDKSVFDNNLSIQKGDQDRRNQEMLANAQANANIRLANAQGNTQRDVAAITAQGNLFSSLLGSIGSGNPNYRFWS